jgi:hypothetical protein
MADETTPTGDTDEPLANFDPWVEGGVHGFIGKPIARYDIIFDDEPALRRWYGFIRGLKSVYPGERTIGGRIDRFLLDTFAGVQPPPPKKSIKKPKKGGVVEAVAETPPNGSEPELL